MKIAIIALASLAIAPVAMGVEISVDFAPEFIEALEDDYGTREGEVLTKEITKDLNRELEKAGVDVATIGVTILKATPNKPTMQQLSDNLGLDYSRSISIGGMKMSADVMDASGNIITSLEYGWFENQLRFAGPTTWSDARRASDRFAHKLAKQLATS